MGKDVNIKLLEWEHNSGIDRIFAYYSKELNDLTINAVRVPKKPKDEIKLSDIKQIDISEISKDDLENLIKSLTELLGLYSGR